jgi:hypothetical protein
VSDFNGDFEGRVVDSLARIETKLDGHTEELKDHESRIRATEGSLKSGAPVAGAAGAGAAGAIELLSHLFHRLFK